jgi:hypothetical protein
MSNSYRKSPALAPLSDMKNEFNFNRLYPT